MVKILRMGLPGESFIVKEVEITQEEYNRLDKLGRLYKPSEHGENK